VEQRSVLEGLQPSYVGGTSELSEEQKAEGGVEGNPEGERRLDNQRG